MASAATIDALTALPAIDPAAAALGQSLCALIGDAGPDTAIDHDPGAAQWFGARDGVSFAILRAGGRPASIDPDRLGDTVALLDRVDPLLVEIEKALDLSLEPQSLDERYAGDVVIVRITGGDATILLGVPLVHAGRADWHARVAALTPPARATPVLVRCEIDGPRIGVVEAGDLAAGDLILIGARVAARLATGDSDVIAGQLDIAAGLFAPQPQGGRMADNDPAAARDFAVPLTIRLPDRVTSAASLAALRPGTTLPLGPLTDGMAVELLVADRLLAKGELVQLGDRFAVLIEERASIDDVAPAADEPLAEDAE